MKTRNINDPGSERFLDPELSLYRDYTVAMLRRYFRMSIELGRLPSILGREFFRAKVTSYRMHTFEDVVILVHDVDRCISRLDVFSQLLIARVVLEERTHEEAAEALGMLPQDRLPPHARGAGSPERDFPAHRNSAEAGEQSSRRVIEYRPRRRGWRHE